MKFKTTYLLFALLGLMLVLLAYAMWNNTPPADTSLYALPGAHDPKHPFEASDVDRVEIKRVRPEGGNAGFHQGGRHALADRGAAPPARRIRGGRPGDRDPQRPARPGGRRAGQRRGRGPGAARRSHHAQTGRRALVPAQRRQRQLRIVQGRRLRLVAGAAQGNPARVPVAAGDGPQGRQRLPRPLRFGLQHLRLPVHQTVAGQGGQERFSEGIVGAGAPGRRPLGVQELRRLRRRRGGGRRRGDPRGGQAAVGGQRPAENAFGPPRRVAGRFRGGRRDRPGQVQPRRGEVQRIDDLH